MSDLNLEMCKSSRQAGRFSRFRFRFYVSFMITFMSIIK